MNLRTPTHLLAEALTPAQAPLAMPTRPVDAVIETRSLPAPPGLLARRAGVAALALAIVGGLLWAMVGGLLRDGFDPEDAVILGLYAPNVAIVALAAATALAGLVWRRGLRRRGNPQPGWRPRGRTAVLIPARNEDIHAVGARIEALGRDLRRAGLDRDVDIFLLSDSDARPAIAAEERLALELSGAGEGPRFYYRRRLSNEGRKPGNIAHWLRNWGAAYRYMLTLDADSVMSARRIAALIHRMETRPRLGMIQTGVRLTGGESRFARLQQRAGRLYAGPFTRGLAGWVGNAGNYWGHNALIRTKAFADAAGLPRLSGRPPFGGDILSHDFIEAAWMRRAGWSIELDPCSLGSAEGGPETLMEFHKRDRRWCQGNLQHFRLIGARGLHPVSRLHLALGIGGYLAAPLWLGLVLAAILFGAVDGLILPAVLAVVLILVQKLTGVADWLLRRRGRWSRRIVLRAAAAELAVSTALAPVVMLRQTVSVISVLTGHDCGWKPAGGAARAGDAPWLEPVAAAAILVAAVPGLADPLAALLVAPIVAPLFAAPWLVPWLDRAPGAEAEAEVERPARLDRLGPRVATAFLPAPLPVPAVVRSQSIQPPQR